MVVQRKPNVQSSLVVFDLLGDFGPGPDLFFCIECIMNDLEELEIKIYD